MPWAGLSARYCVTGYRAGYNRYLDPSFPWGPLVMNLIGFLVIGFIGLVIMEKVRVIKYRQSITGKE